MMAKKHRNIQHALMSAGIAALTLTSCTHGSNVFDDSAFNATQKEKYEKSWTETFGAIDPQQDWNMATEVEATVSCTTQGANAKALIYTDNPFTADALLLKELQLSSGKTARMNAPKGMKQVYAVVNDGKKNLSQGFYDIADGRVEINGNPTAQAKTRATATRAASCPVTVGKKIDLGFYKEPIHHEAVYDTSWDGKTYVRWDNGKIAYYVKMEDGGYYISTDNSNWTKATFDNPYYNELYWNGQPTGIVAETDGSGLLWVGNDTDTWGTTKYIAKRLISEAYDETFPYGDFYELNGVTGEAGPEWKQGVGYGLYGKGKFFEEYIRYWEGSKPTLEEYDISKIERGASITTQSAGPLTLSLVYGATQIADAFGYCYYKEGQDRRKAPRYILIRDARPQSNIYHDTWKGAAVGDMELGNCWGNYEYLLNDKDRTPAEWETAQNKTPMQLYTAAYNKRFVGTNYKMVYFGDNYDATPSYTFPAGTHVEFFIININDAENPNYKQNLNNFNYGSPEMNKEMMHYRMRDNSIEHGSVKATTWMYGGTQYIGFEDGGGDEDLNDVVFALNGKIKDEDIPEVPTEEPAAEGNSWIIACEDLGSTDDYDFNDIVIKVTHEPGSSTATVTPLAAGGILEAHVYYGDVELGEIHEWLGQEKNEEGSYPMINTGGNTTGSGVTKTINVGSGFSLTDNMGGFNIVVKQKLQTIRISGPETGTAPQMFLLKGDWKWPKEKVRIQDAYPQFKDWNGDAASTEWCNSPQSGLVWN